MGVLPGGIANVDTTNAFQVVSANGNSDLSAADLVGNDEATVKAAFKNRQFTSGSTGSVWTDSGGILAQVFGAIPGGALGLALISYLVNLIGTFISPLPIIGTAWDTFASFLGVTHTTANTATDIGNNAQSTAESALALASQTAAQVAAGSNMSYSDGFGRTTDPTAQTDLGTDYSRDADSGSGTWGVDGAGNAHATASGATPQEWRDRNTVAVFATDKQAGSVVVSTVPQAAGGFGTYSCRIGISLRENSAGTTSVSAYYDSGTMYIGYWVSGSYTQLGSMAITQSNGDLFEFHAGCDPGGGYDDYSFECLVGTQKLSVTDSGHASQKAVGGGYKYGALRARNGTVQFGFFTIQTAAPDVQILNLFDRT